MNEEWNRFELRLGHCGLFHDTLLNKKVKIFVIKTVIKTYENLVLRTWHMHYVIFNYVIFNYMAVNWLQHLSLDSTKIYFGDYRRDLSSTLSSMACLSDRCGDIWRLFVESLILRDCLAIFFISFELRAKPMTSWPIINCWFPDWPSQ